LKKWVKLALEKRYFKTNLDKNPNLVRIFEEEAKKAGLQVKSPISRNMKRKGFMTTATGFYNNPKRKRIQRRRKIPEMIKIIKINAQNEEIIMSSLK